MARRACGRSFGPMIRTRILVAYASRHGSTREVAEAVAATLRSRGLSTTILPAAEVGHLRGYAGVVLGGALYMGRLHKDARRFLARHHDALEGRALAVFALGPRTLAPDDVADSRSQLMHALASAPPPASVAVFGGVVRPGELRFPFSRLPASDERDWAAIEAWAGELAATFSRAKSHDLRQTTDAASGLIRTAAGPGDPSLNAVNQHDHDF